MSHCLTPQEHDYLSYHFVYINRFPFQSALLEEYSDATNDLRRTRSVFRASDRRIARFLDVWGVAGKPTHASIGVSHSCSYRLIHFMRQGRGKFTHHRDSAHVRQIRFCLMQRIFSALVIINGELAFCNVVIGLENRSGQSPLVSLQRPATRNHDLRPISLRMYELSFPAPGAEQLLIDFYQWRGKDRLCELMRDFVHGLLSGPSIKLFGTAIPIGDDVEHIAHEDRVVCEVEEAGLLAQERFGALALGILLLQRLVGSPQLLNCSTQVVARAS